MNTYITTPIYYVNAQPHLGHAYTTIVADTYSRFRRLTGANVRFQTGTDEHGDKIAEAAAREDVAPKDYADRISRLFQDTWPLLEIQPDNFIRTTDSRHIATVQAILQKVHDSGDIYFDEYSGLYCRGCERFLTEKELVDGLCPDHQVPPQEIAEQNYFFRMSHYQQRLIDHIRENPNFITPDRYRNEVLSFLSEPLEDLCISRPKSRLTWGIELPFDANFVTYVWFDALINYLSGLDYPDGPDFSMFWPVAEHVIAKDILKPHAIYWPTMLMSMGLPLYQKLHVHGYWNVDDTKMSKSIGNVVRPAQLIEEYGVDTLRYFTLREMSFGLDASFSSDAIVARKNSDLANDIGNLYSRSMAMLQKYTTGRVPAPGPSAPADSLLQKTTEQMLVTYLEEMGNFQFHRALQAVWEVISAANKYIVTNEPWTLAREAENHQRLHTVLYTISECLRLLAMVLGPIIPCAAAKMVYGLGLEADSSLVADMEQSGRWGLLPAGTILRPIEPLFPRMEKTQVKETGQQVKHLEKTDVSPVESGPGLISFEQFQKVDLRVAEIVAAERLKKSDKLLQLTVMAPEKRTIVAGIAESYTPEELIGRLVLVVANLKPAKLMGITSQGMVLVSRAMADGKERMILTTVSGTVPAGSRVA
jgi:methionyl-tRNA synthetase